MAVTNFGPGDLMEEVSPDFTGEETPVAEPVVEPVVPAPVEQAISPEVRAQIELETRQQIFAEQQRTQQDQYRQQQAAQQQAGQPVNPNLAIAENFYTDPLATVEAIKASLRDEIRQEMRPQFAPIHADRLTSDIAGDLEPETQTFIKSRINGIDPNNLNAESRELLRLAAVGKDAEVKARKNASAPRVTAEPAHAEPTVKINGNQFKETNDERKRLGLPAMSAKEFAAL